MCVWACDWRPCVSVWIPWYTMKDWNWFYRMNHREAAKWLVDLKNNVMICPLWLAEKVWVDPHLLTDVSSCFLGQNKTRACTHTHTRSPDQISKQHKTVIHSSVNTEASSSRHARSHTQTQACAHAHKHTQTHRGLWSTLFKITMIPFRLVTIGKPNLCAALVMWQVVRKGNVLVRNANTHRHTQGHILHHQFKCLRN